MSSKKHGNNPNPYKKQIVPKGITLVDSLLDSMTDGNEYASIVPLQPKNPELKAEIIRALKDIETVRKRPCICYLANTVRNTPGISIEPNDDLPFNELIKSVPTDSKEVDIIVVTPGGSGNQVSQFVNSLRSRFDFVHFILPYMCMSAGTMWAMSGDTIWMDQRAYIGPIDPQVRAADGSFVPAQSLFRLLLKLRDDGAKELNSSGAISWEIVRLLDTMDKRQLGDALNLSEYSSKLVTDFLKDYKFRNWVTHSSTGQPVTPQDKEDRAKQIAASLCDNNFWKSHAHGITREVAMTPPLKIKIDKLEDVVGLERAVRRFWALMYWAFDRIPVSKMFLSEGYFFLRLAKNAENTKK